jgi:hypothetical protein
MIDIQQIINDAIQVNSQVRGGKRDGAKFHVSDAGTCYRKRYFKRLGVEPTGEIPVASLRKMYAGDAGHLHLQKLLSDHGKLFATEGTVQTDQIKGHFDGIIKDGNAKTVLEIKTIEKWAMGYIKKDGPKPEHIIQMFTYWSFLRKDYTQLDQATLFYVKREDFEGVPFNFVWDKDVEAQVAKEWLPLIEYWDKQQLPPCTCGEDYGGKGVNYCRYANEDKTECCSEDLIKTLVKE